MVPISCNVIDLSVCNSRSLNVYVSITSQYAKDKIGIEVLLLKFDNFIKINNINNNK